MKILKELLTKPLQLQALPKWIPTVLLCLALIGFADATYLTAKHFQGEIPPCAIDGCEIVLTSEYSEVLGIPVSLMGAIYYLVLSVLLVVYLDTKKELFLRIVLLSSVLGLVASLWFSFLQLFVIKAFCQYCTVSSVASTVIFIFSAFILFKNRLNEQKN